MIRRGMSICFCIVLLFFTTTSTIKIKSQSQGMNIELINSYQTVDDVDYVAIHNDYAFLCVRSLGLLILNISDPTNVNLVSQLAFPSIQHVEGIVFQGSYAYLLDRATTLYIVNITDLTVPSIVSSFTYDSTGYGDSLHVDGSFTYIGDHNQVLIVVDISDPENPFEVAQIYTGGAVRDMVQQENYLFMLDESYGVHVINISDPTQPNTLYLLEMVGYNLFDISLQDNLVFVVGRNTITTVNIEDPNQLIIVETTSLEGSFFRNDALLNASYLYVLQANARILVFDISTPDKPQTVTNYREKDLGDNLALYESYLFVPRIATRCKIDVLNITYGKSSSLAAESNSSVDESTLNNLYDFIALTFQNLLFWTLVLELGLLIALIMYIKKKREK